MMLISSRFSSLHFAVRPRVVIKFLGQLFIPLAVLTLVPAIYSFVAGNTQVTIRYAIVIAALLSIGIPCAKLKCASNMQANEALVISALVFTLTSLIMTVPLLAYGFPFIDALFETVSGVTTTGLSTLASIENKPDTFLFSRAWMQWVGGLGVTTLALAMMIESGKAARQLGSKESDKEDVIGGTRAYAKRVLIVYLTLTAIGVLVLLLFGLDFHDALVHCFAAISTGGFSNYDNSLAGLSGWPVRLAITAISFMGAISFFLYIRCARKKKYSLFFSDVGFRTLLVCCLVSTLALFLSFRTHSDLSTLENFFHALAMAVSAQTSAGFSSFNAGDMNTLEKLVMIGSMVIGGDIGSTAGGIKVIRLVIIVKLIQIILLRASIIRFSDTPLRLKKQRLLHHDIETAMALVFIYVFVIFASWAAFLAYGYDPMNSLFDVVSAVGTVGISAGVITPDLATPLKLVLCLDMLMGRVEIIAIIILLLPGTWIGKKRIAT